MYGHCYQIQFEMMHVPQGTVYTFFTHEWIFKRSSSNDLLYAELNGIKSKFFEGCRFKATFDRNIVTITSGIAYMIYWNNDFSISDNYSKSFSELFIWAHFLLFQALLKDWQVLLLLNHAKITVIAKLLLHRNAKKPLQH